MFKHALLGLLFLLQISISGQENVPSNGPRQTNEIIHAFKGATIHTSGSAVLENGTLIISGDRITAIGNAIPIPTNAVVHDLKGKHIWPGIVEPYATEGFAKRKRPGRDDVLPGAHYWNDAIHASFNGAAAFTIDDKAMDAWRKMGVTSIITHRKDGIIRGSGVAMHTAGRSVQEDMIKTEASFHFSFRKGSSQDRYPSSLMGSIALLKQTFLDANWYANQGKLAQGDVELEALLRQSKTRSTVPWVFQSEDVDDNARIAKLGEAFRTIFLIKGTGKEYLRKVPFFPEPLISSNPNVGKQQSFIIPLNFPKAYDVSDPYDAMEVSLSDMQHWENAAYNPTYLQNQNIDFVFTSDGLKAKSKLIPHIRKCLQFGLDTAVAVDAITATTAKLFNLNDIGVLEAGRFADLLITSAHLFDDGNILYETWVAGERFIQRPINQVSVVGEYNLKLDGQSLHLSIKKGKNTLQGFIKHSKQDTVNVPIMGTSNGKTISLNFDGDSFKMKGKVRANAMIHNDGALLDGQAQKADGNWFSWSAVRISTKEDSASRSIPPDSVRKVPSAFTPFMDTTYKGNVLIRKTTVWTNANDGILKNTDVLVLDGKIAQLGRDLSLNAKALGISTLPEVIDGRGMHLTTGIIDEHVHVGISRGVNESSQAVTAEVNIGDVVDPDNIGIYRLLAGGVTTAQLLHGSANPIGGQSALIKMKWGNDASGLLIDDAPKHIKFALGENVKQSRSSSSRRFPKSRMGVEQVFYDAFHRARSYEKEWENYRNSLPKPGARNRRRNGKRATPLQEPRRDLELEALLEILNGERFITCHSYVASEIDMLMHVADSMGFRVNTFTHILEGYKLADKMKAHGASASTFSDWWAYKYEVKDAIPHNAALLTHVGVNTGLNSDDAEMGRRLNQEAAKAVKYGGLSEEEAWKLVTLNPAKMLKLDKRMGSIEVGKDADLVLWNTNPLAINAIPQKTLIDGHVYFSVPEDLALQKNKTAERQRLIQLMLNDKKKGKPTQKVQAKEQHHWHCDTIGEEP